jgi:hypothetical protein
MKRPHPARHSQPSWKLKRTCLTEVLESIFKSLVEFDAAPKSGKRVGSGATYSAFAYATSL